jgi:type III restriction enzyme
MATGTGKTLVNLRTLYRLHTTFGWNKFIVVVPTLTIRAGVMSKGLVQAHSRDKLSYVINLPLERLITAGDR